MTVLDQEESPQICNHMSQLYIPLYILWTRKYEEYSLNGCQVLKLQEESLPFIY